MIDLYLDFRTKTIKTKLDENSEISKHMLRLESTQNLIKTMFFFALVYTVCLANE